MGSGTYLYDLADDLLAEALDGLSLARTGHAPPSRTYVSQGEPADDTGLLSCEQDGQLTVHIDEGDGIEAFFPRGSGSMPETPCVFAPYARFCVVLYRCVPKVDDEGNAPSAEELDASARDLYTDAWALYTHLATLWGNGTLFGGALGCKDVEWESMLPIHPQGGAAGWRLCLRLQLNDSGPAEEEAS